MLPGVCTSELPQNGCMHIFRDMELQGQGRCCLGCEIMTYRTLPGSPTGVWISLCRVSVADLCSAPVSIPSSASLVSQQSLPKPSSPKAKERGHGCLDLQLLGVAQGTNWLGLVAWKWLTFTGTSTHRSRAAWFPWAMVAQRLPQHAAQNRVYWLILSALSHKEDLGDRVPYLRGLWQMQCWCQPVPKPGAMVAPHPSGLSSGGGEKLLPTTHISTSRRQ